MLLLTRSWPAALALLLLPLARGRRPSPALLGGLAAGAFLAAVLSGRFSPGVPLGVFDTDITPVVTVKVCAALVGGWLMGKGLQRSGSGVLAAVVAIGLVNLLWTLAEGW